MSRIVRLLIVFAIILAFHIMIVTACDPNLTSDMTWRSIGAFLFLMLFLVVPMGLFLIAVGTFSRITAILIAVAGTLAMLLICYLWFLVSYRPLGMISPIMWLLLIISAGETIIIWFVTRTRDSLSSSHV